METLPQLAQLSEQEKDALIVAFWAEVQNLRTRLADLEAKRQVPAVGQWLQAVYDKIEVPPVKPIVTRVEPYGGRCADCGQTYVASVPAGLEPGTPFGTSIQSLATYLRYT